MIDTETSRERQKRMTELLNAAFAPAQLNIEDESHLHVGHAGAASGGGHYQVRIVSSAFAGQSRVRRHQMVYQALGEMIDGDIHALGIIARTPNESAIYIDGNALNLDGCWACSPSRCRCCCSAAPSTIKRYILCYT